MASRLNTTLGPKMIRSAIVPAPVSTFFRSNIPRAMNDETPAIRPVAVEASSALDQLQVALAQEVALRQELELELFDVQTALARARVELAGTQAGERRARHLALHDGLTGLPNRGFFGERLTHMLSLEPSKKHQVAVLYLDLDGFKPVNDVHGHATGDELLKIVAARLRAAVRDDDVVGRLGGDEFACLLTDLPGRDQLCHLVCKLFDAVSAPIQIGNISLTIRPSIGISTCAAGTDSASAETLISHADAAMYCAKRHQTGYAFFEEPCAD